MGLGVVQVLSKQVVVDGPCLVAPLFVRLVEGQLLAAMTLVGHPYPAEGLDADQIPVVLLAGDL